MGRRKITIEKIDSKDRLKVAFSKRRNGLFKKAKEFNELCGASVAAIAFSPAGKPFTFSTGDNFDKTAASLLSGLPVPDPTSVQGNDCNSDHVVAALMKGDVNALIHGIANMDQLESLSDSIEKLRAIAVERIQQLEAKERTDQATAGSSIPMPPQCLCTKSVEAKMLISETSGVSERNNDEEELMRLLDGFKDQATAESSIPLPPHCLYTKPVEAQRLISRTSWESERNSDEEELMTLLDGFKDKVRAESSIPLPPHCLYTNPVEAQMSIGGTSWVHSLEGCFC